MAWAAVARTPICMLWLEMTDDGILVCCLMCRLTPTRSSSFSPLKNMKASPATSFFELTKTLHPVVSKWRLGWPRKMCLKCHSLLCKSVATNSCHGGCWDISKGGRQSSACLRSTEKPPCVLVSEAVSVLQNECTVHFSGSWTGASGLVGSLWSSSGNKVICAYTSSVSGSALRWMLITLQRILDGRLKEGICCSKPWCIDASSCSMWPSGK